MSDYKYISDVEYYKYVHTIANGLAEAGFKKGDKIAFYCETRYEWMAMVLACSCRGIIVVTVYATLGTDAVNIALKETDVAGAFVSSETYSKLTELDFCKSKPIRIICCDDIDLDENGIKLKDMLNAPKVDDDIPNPDDIAIIMYTSGTAGSPKGVVALQKNLLGITHSFAHKMGYGKHTRYICYLPLAHIFELTIEFCCLVWGATLGYSSQRTLTSAFMHESQCDLHAFGPTFMNGVPTVFNKIRKILEDKISRSPAITRMIFNLSFFLKKTLYVDMQLCPRYISIPIIWLTNKIVFKKITQEIFGTNLGGVIMGGSPLSKELQIFLQVALDNVEIMQGYGMTETCGPVCNMYHGDYAYGTIGVLYPHFEAKLRDT
ncbi:Long-chain-fatty-acid--CoA ligase [Entamoeba marina]